MRLHAESGEIEVVNAGHNPGFLLAPGAAPVQFDAAGPPLGLLPGMRYSSERARFSPGARLLFYTDGLTEVFRGDEEFGPERLLHEFSTCPCQNADGILDALWTAIEDFAEGGPQGDDMTALALAAASPSTGSTEIEA
jgi:sigma-B regulation protein RsbU (phosphoserine phosphatase)